jgi:hypothetical protein
MKIARYMFSLEVNPFRKSISLKCVIDEVEYTRELYYEELDDWQTFQVGGRRFDLHNYYDAEFLVEIFEVVDNLIDLSAPLKTRLTFKLTE